MTSITLDKAKADLKELVHQLAPGDEILVTENGRLVARIVGAAGLSQQRVLGGMRGTVKYVAPDFDAPLEDFQDYMK